MKVSGYTFFERTIIDSINLSDYNIESNSELLGDILKVHSIFKSEYGHMIERVGELNSFKEWLQGLPTALSVPCYNHEIINNYNNYNNTVLNSKSEDSLLSSYYERLRDAFFTLKDNL